MAEKKLFIEDKMLNMFAGKVGTPFHLYDERGIEENAKDFLDAFSWSEGFVNYFAVKALPNVNIVRLLSSLGFGADCSSLPELKTALKAGLPPEKIMYTSNDTPDEEFREVLETGAILNLDDMTHIEDILRLNDGKFPEVISFRYNPGPGRTGNVIIGNPVEAKYGVTYEQLFDCYRIAKEKGARKFMLHTMVASNELEEDYIVETARMLFSLVGEINEKCGVRISQVDLGGGIGIPYRPEEEGIDFFHLSARIKELYVKMIEEKGLPPLRISFECGRAITGPYGILVSKVRHVARKYKTFVGLDASMADLMRPALYGAYHHISILGKEDMECSEVYDVTGSLCENNDKFAIDRRLPPVEKGDIVVIFDTGAHGHSMGFNYNAKLRSAEYLYKGDGSFVKIRRKETYEDYIATELDVPEEVAIL